MKYSFKDIKKAFDKHSIDYTQNGRTVTICVPYNTNSSSISVPVGMVQIPYPIIFNWNLDESLDKEDDIGLAVTVNKKIIVGCTCDKCDGFYPYAEKLEDESFVCFSCRMEW